MSGYTGDVSVYTDDLRPDTVPVDVWGDYRYLMSRADRGEMEGDHLQQIHQIRRDYPDLDMLEQRLMRRPG